MKKMTIEESYDIIGGINITAALFNGITSAVSKIFELGRSFGSALRRLTEGRICSLK